VLGTLLLFTLFASKFSPEKINTKQKEYIYIIHIFIKIDTKISKTCFRKDKKIAIYS